jgi:hypothetical protein
LNKSVVDILVHKIESPISSFAREENLFLSSSSDSFVQYNSTPVPHVHLASPVFRLSLECLFYATSSKVTNDLSMDIKTTIFWGADEKKTVRSEGKRAIKRGESLPSKQNMTPDLSLNRILG